jgi:hypothetical protein
MTSTPPQRRHRGRRIALAAAAGLLAALPAPAHARTHALLPDLIEAPPSQVSIAVVGAQQQLIFESAAIDIGAGPLIVDGAKQNSDPNQPMTASQALLSSNGQIRANAFPNVGLIYFDYDHYHWHFKAFERYWLRRANDNATIVGDRKTGFCMGDRFIAVNAYKLPGESFKPGGQFAPDCMSGDLTSRSIREGISIGWGDNYVPQLEGQFLDVTHVANGRYYLVHTVNPVRALHESDYANDSSSLLISLTRSAPGAVPAVKVLAACAGTARCDPARRPRLVRRPQVLGARVGHRARCAPGRWTQHPRRFSYQWYRFGFILPAERSATYGVASSDAGKPLSCKVTAIGTYGTRTAGSAAVVARR